MIPELFDDQDKARVDLRLALRVYFAVLLYAPTGFGKTILMAALIRLLIAANKKVIVCLHRVDLITQTAKTFDQFGIPYSYIAAGYHHNIYRTVNIASIPTLQNRLGQYDDADYVFVDEAHLSMGAGWARVINHYKAKGARIIGLTGSPARLDGRPLGAVWDTMVLGPSTRWLIENGRLCKYRAFAPASLDLSQVHSRNGEYVQSEIDDLMAGKAVMAGAVKHWRKYAAGKRTIVFTPSVKRSEELAATFRENGIMAVALDGNTPQADRIKAFHAFADRQIEVLINCELFCAGYDLAAQVGRDVTVEAVVLYRPTQSLALHLQQMGRALRKKPEPAIILDLVGNIARLGLPDEDREWSLDGEENGKPKAKQEERVKLCPECGAAHDPAPRCPECGHAYIAKARTVAEVEGELAEIDIEAARRQRVVEQATAKGLDDLIRLATARGYKSPEKWAAHVHTARLAKRGAAA